MPKRWKTPATARLMAQSIDEIVGFLGNDYRRKLKPLAESRWAHDPFARGSYSHALPGHAGARAVLAAPVDGRLFFAGEATSPHFFSTAHGARDGERAARGGRGSEWLRDVARTSVKAIFLINHYMFELLDPTHRFSSVTSIIHTVVIAIDKHPCSVACALRST